MKRINTPSNEYPPIMKKYINEYLSRCPNCNLICSFKLDYKEVKYLFITNVK